MEIYGCSDEGMEVEQYKQGGYRVRSLILKGAAAAEEEKEQEGGEKQWHKNKSRKTKKNKKIQQKNKNKTTTIRFTRRLQDKQQEH